jgi:molybdopterin converting factor small subunit
VRSADDVNDDPSTATGTNSGTGTGVEDERSAEDTLTVTVRYFAGAAAAAGRQDEVVALAPGATLGDLLALLADLHGGGLARVLDASSYLLDEVHAEPTDRVPGGTTLDVLPPFAGG